AAARLLSARHALRRPLSHAETVVAARPRPPTVAVRQQPPPRHMSRLLAILTASVAVAGAGVATAAERTPEPPSATGFREAPPARAAPDAVAPADGRWWRVFADPVL